jgi:hypothetical protein
MTIFAADLQAFKERTEALTDAVFVDAVGMIGNSIKFGSPLTGAPALPVANPKYFRAGALRDSVTTRFNSPTEAIVFTTKRYDPHVEDTTEGHQYASGGPHGWILTAAAFDGIVTAVAKNFKAKKPKRDYAAAARKGWETRRAREGGGS